eukprot:2596714-Prymnesium_polylepis.1
MSSERQAAMLLALVASAPASSVALSPKVFPTRSRSFSSNHSSKLPVSSGMPTVRDSDGGHR